MATISEKVVYTPDDLLTMPDGDRYELVDGELVEIPMSGLSSLVAGRLHARLERFVDAGSLGFVFPPDCTFQCFPDAPLKVRRPDVSFIRKGRISFQQLESGHVPVAPDLAVEVVSPNDLFESIEVKVAEYLAAGVPLIWLIIPKTRSAWILRRDGAGRRLGGEDELSGEEVLPGFRYRLGELFPPRPA